MEAGGPTTEAESEGLTAESESPNPTTESERPSPSPTTESEGLSPKTESESESPSPTTESESPSPKTESESESESPSPTTGSESESPSPTTESESPSPTTESESPSPTTEPASASPSPTTESETESPSPTTESESESPSPTESASATAEGGSGSDPKTRKGSLRERIAQDREAQRLRRAEFLAGRLVKALALLVVLLAAAWIWRAPVLRQIAQRDLGDVRVWALNWLCELEDPGSFDLFMAGLAEEERTELFTTLIFRIAGRAQAPVEGKPAPPDDADAVAAHGATILSFLQSGQAEQNRAGLRAMVALRERAWIDSPERLAAVGALLDPQRGAITRRFAALVLRGVGVPEHLRQRVLHAALEDADRQVRRFAVQALAASGDQSVVERLRLGLRDPAPEVKREVYLALTKLGAEVALGDLVDIYEESPMHRDVVLDVLGSREGPEVLRLLERGIGDPSPGTRLAAVEALAKRPGEQVRVLLLDGLQDSNASVRLAAIDALASRPDASRSLGPLVEALSHHEGWEELRRLHLALSTAASDAQVPTPIQRVESSWIKAIDGWRRYLEARQR